MSVAAVKIFNDKIVIGADTQITFSDGQHKKSIENAKLWHGKYLTFACVGNVAEFSQFSIYCEKNEHRFSSIVDISSRSFVLNYFCFFMKWRANKLGLEDSSLVCSYILVFNERVFLVDGDMYITEIKDFIAIGSGMDYAATALTLGSTVEVAIDVACKLCVFCQPPIEIITVNKSIGT